MCTQAKKAKAGTKRNHVLASTKPRSSNAEKTPPIPLKKKKKRHEMQR